MLGGAEERSRSCSQFTTSRLSGSGVKPRRLTEGVDGKGRVRRGAERSDSCRVTGSNPKLVLSSFDQSSHLGDRGEES